MKKLQFTPTREAYIIVRDFPRLRIELGNIIELEEESIYYDSLGELFEYKNVFGEKMVTFHPHLLDRLHIKLLEEAGYLKRYDQSRNKKRSRRNSLLR